jgi:hypothetical protein
MLVAYAKLPPEAAAFTLPEAEVLRNTSRYLVWKPDGVPMAIAGEMLPSALGNQVYLWLDLRKDLLDRRRLLEGMREVKRYLAALPWRPYAECSRDEPENARFLIGCGFSELMTFEDRTLYRWGE